jgi:hypothetical protein
VMSSEVAQSAPFPSLPACRVQVSEALVELQLQGFVDESY